MIFDPKLKHTHRRYAQIFKIDFISWACQMKSISASASLTHKKGWEMGNPTCNYDIWCRGFLSVCLLI